LATISADEFKRIVMDKLQKKPVVVIFAEENVSNVLNSVTCPYRLLRTSDVS
jgi:hypothetical protein